MLIAGHTAMDSVIKESCGCRGFVVATADAPSVAVSSKGNYEEKSEGKGMMQRVRVR